MRPRYRDVMSRETESPEAFAAAAPSSSFEGCRYSCVLPNTRFMSYSIGGEVSIPRHDVNADAHSYGCGGNKPGLCI